jgi:hypothetical protein
MDLLAREWRKCRVILNLQKHKWINEILPRNMVSDALKNIVNDLFFELYGYLDNDENERTVEMLLMMKQEIHVMAGYLVLASHESNIEVTISQH